MILNKAISINKILKFWILAKTIIIALCLIYTLYNFFILAQRDDERELFAIELSFYTITSLLLIYFFFHMYQTMKYLILFDFIFLIFVGYQFHMNYLILCLDIITIVFIFLDNNDIQNLLKRKFRKIKG